ncbi:uncharacterized protein LOC130818830 isoform X2 [Amaranthus tricolor]|uniref:uncharacterized protein LOC130818830 isoform X2 n=1 Tax=Amaranthus tricolor TaxID=29722 RepID=UPI0025882ED5|nr:uncharacterized protein LOC130818830 isoform X2 [Amaranthus tricolor]
MAILGMRFTALTVVLAMACVFTSFQNDNLMAYGQCEGDITSIISQCAKYVRKAGPKMRPSKDCCGVARNADIPCLCKYLTKDIEQYISVEKAVYIAQTCGVALQHGSKCGSYTIP